MSCALRKNRGSGYVKESGKDTLNPALEALKASRDAQINRLFPPLAGSAVTMQPLAGSAVTMQPLTASAVTMQPLTASAVKPSTSCIAPIHPISQTPLSRPQ